LQAGSIIIGAGTAREVPMREARMRVVKCISCICYDYVLSRKGKSVRIGFVTTRDVIEFPNCSSSSGS
jgi:hypothetical protein